MRYCPKQSSGWMHMRGFGVLGVLIALVMAFPAAAAPANPELLARDYFLDGGKPHEEQLKIGSMDLVVRIAGGSAVTTATVRFENPSGRPVEGDFTLDLPAGSVITGYALDLNGEMVEGVLVGQRKARLAYEAKVRQGIDPGLATVTRAGDFKTRVFPILPGKGRTIRLTFVTPLHPDRPFVFPLSSDKPVGALSLDITGADLATAPAVTAPGGLTVRVNGGKVSGENVALTGPLTIGPAQRGSPLLTTRHSSGDLFFEVEDAALPRAGGEIADRRVRIYWDRSRSRADDDLAAEARLIALYLDQARPTAVDLVLFDAGKPRIVSFTGADAKTKLLAALKDVTYGSASSVDGLFDLPLAAADVCLFVSDGVITVDAFKPVRAPCRLYAVSSAADADRGYLRALAGRSGGEHLDLTAGAPETLLARLNKDAPRVVDVRTAEGDDVEFRSLPAGPGRFRIVGLRPSTGALTVRLAAAQNAVRTYVVPAGTPGASDGMGALWALDQLGDMGANDQPDQDRVVAFARRYSVASPAASFIVLETVEDYALAEIEPPAGLGKDFRAEYRRLTAARAAALKAERADRLDDMIELWDEQKEWWATRFDPRARPKDTNRGQGLALAAPPPPPPSPLQARPAAPAADAAAAPPASRGDTSVGEVVVTAQRRDSRTQDSPIAVEAFSSESLDAPATATGRPMTVELAPWDPDRPYLEALKAAKPEDFWSVFRAEEKTAGGLPAFYLDVAEYLFRAGRVEEARAVVLSALDLPAADTTTLTILADRMTRYGDDTRAIWLYEHILYLEPDRPQPRRNLALALIDRAERTGTGRALAKADYRRALDLLTEVVMTPWDDAYDGIEMIALMEANRIIPKLKALGVTDIPLDRRLIALLDVDLRVVMEWNTDITDMDLWVDEPTGERAIYNNPRTAVGGRLSNDMTEGYGPEEYLLRRTPRGEYVIQANVYSADRLNPNGAVTIRVHIYRAWGRPDEQVETLEVELTPGEHGTRKLGGVTVGARPATAP